MLQNTPPPRSREEQSAFMSRRDALWVATWHDVDLIPSMELFEEKGIPLQAGVFQKEKGAQGGDGGKLHFQCYFQFKKKVTFAKIRSSFPKDPTTLSGIWWDFRKGSHEEALEYCTKEETRQEPPVFLGTFTDEVHARRFIQGKRRRDDDRGGGGDGGGGGDTDFITSTKIAKIELVKTLRAAAGTNFTPKEAWLAHPMAYLSCATAISNVINMTAEQRDWAMEIGILCGSSGTGKSKYARDNWPDAYYPPFSEENGKLWFDTYSGQDTVVIEEFTGQWPFNFLMQFTDRYKLLIPVKGSFAVMRAKRVVFTTHLKPTEWYTDNPALGISWLQLRRRITWSKVFIRTSMRPAKFVATDVPEWRNDEALNDEIVNQDYDDFVTTLHPNIIDPRRIWREAVSTLPRVRDDKECAYYNLEVLLTAIANLTEPPPELPIDTIQNSFHSSFRAPK